MDFNKHTLIEKLDVISDLFHKSESIKKKMNEFVPDDSYERKVSLPIFPGEYENEEERDTFLNKCDHASENAATQIGDLYNKIYAPKKPEEPKIKEFKAPSKTNEENDKANKYGCLSVIGIIFAIFFGLGFLVNIFEKEYAFTLPIILALSFVGIILFGISKFKVIKINAILKKRTEEALNAYNKEKETVIADYNAKLKEYEEAENSHKTKLNLFLEEYKVWRQIYLEKAKEESIIAEKLEQDRIVGVEKINKEELTPVLTELTEVNDIVSSNYLPKIDVINNLLKDGRADSFKEAINLYEEIRYRERQLQLQKDQEEQRRFEEMLRRQDEERRHQEEMRFLEEKEYQRQKEEEQRRQDEERRHREEMVQRDEQERNRLNEEKRQKDSESRNAQSTNLARKKQEDDSMRRQCNTCKLVSHCSMAFRRPNCASYKPQ